MPDKVENWTVDAQLSVPHITVTHPMQESPKLEPPNPTERNYERKVESNDYLIIDGISTNEVGLYVDTPPMPPMAHRTVTGYEIPGRTETLTRKNMMFDDTELVFSCFLFDYGFRPDDIYTLLVNAKKVTFSEAPWYYWRVKDVAVSSSYSGYGKQKITVTMQCSPFRYSTDETPMILDSSMATRHYFQTIGNIYSEPLYVVKGLKQSNTGNTEDGTPDVGFTITVNGYQVGFLKSLSGDVYVDVESRKVYQLDGDKMKVVQDLTQGAFWKMMLFPDAKKYNFLQWSEGEFKQLEIYKRERWI